jgi:hypothetical protein
MFKKLAKTFDNTNLDFISNIENVPGFLELRSSRNLRKY